jgi:glutaredoxin
MEKIIMYASDSCNYCKSVKEYLDKEKIDYKVRLIDEWKEEWEQIIGLTGVGLLPTIFYKDNFFLPGRNFSNPERLVFLLKNYKKSKFDDLMVVKQHINTLNYNMSMAFGKMDKLLRQIEAKLNIEENDG